VKPDTRTVNELFERDVRYVVPLYQRPYVWKEDDQWAPLWEDILVLLRHEALDAGVQSHFLGAIVLDQETQAPGRIPQYLVIDGQQRLTTLQLLIAAAVDVLRGNGHADAAGILADLTLNDPRKAAGEDLLKAGLILPALEHCLKCSHLFNLLDSSGSVGVTERMAYILRVRQLALAICKQYVEQMEQPANG